MRTIGLLGGMSWESTASYYRFINEAVKARLGGLHSARLVLHSVDFGVVEGLMRAQRWEELGEHLAAAARSLQAAGADFLVICTNTMHRFAPSIETSVNLPLLHIADATAATIKEAGFTCVGLLGTAVTMEQAFYKERLRDHHGLQVLVPEAEDRAQVHRVIFEELCLGRILPASRDFYRGVMTRLVAEGAQAIILGCTEHALLLSAGDASVPLLDTTEIHARRAVEWALQ